MLKRLMFMLFALLLTVSSVLAQAIAPRCRVCGRKLTECPYKGNHAKKQSEGKKPAEKKKPKKKAPEKKLSHKAEPVKPSAAVVEENSATNMPYQVIDNHTINVYNSIGMEQYLKECQVPSKLKIKGRFGLNGFKALQQCNKHFEELDLSDVEPFPFDEDPEFLLMGAFSLQCIDGIDADRLDLPNEGYIDWAAARYTVKTIVIGDKTEIIYFVQTLNFSNSNLKESKLTDIIVDKNNKKYKSVNGMLLTADGKTLVVYPAGRTRVSADDKNTDIIPDGVETIQSNAFWNCMTDYINLNKVKTIETSAFHYSRFRSIVVPQTVRSIDGHAFADCLELRYITFKADIEKGPSGITMFVNCPELYYISFHKTSSKKIFENLASILLHEKFEKWNGEYDKKSNIQLIVPPGLKGKYKKKLSMLYKNEYRITEVSY